MDRTEGQRQMASFDKTVPGKLGMAWHSVVSHLSFNLAQSNKHIVGYYSISAT